MERETPILLSSRSAPDGYSFGMQMTAGLTALVITGNAVAPLLDKLHVTHFYKHPEIELTRPSTGVPSGKVMLVATTTASATISATIVRLPFPPST